MTPTYFEEGASLVGSVGGSRNTYAPNSGRIGFKTVISLSDVGNLAVILVETALNVG